MCEISNYNFKQHVASDIGVHGQYLPNNNLKSQTYLNKIQEWTEEAQMALNISKTKYMVVNFTNNFQFNTRIELENSLLEEVSDCRLLGLNYNNKLSWAKNFENIVKYCQKSKCQDDHVAQTL